MLAYIQKQLSLICILTHANSGGKNHSPCQLPHLPWTTMGLFPVLLCITNTCSMMSMIARGEVHRPSGVQHDIWSWVTLCTRPDCKIKDRRKYRAGVISSNTGYRSLHTQSQEWMIYSCHMTAADKPAYISLTLVLVTLSIRCMKPFICVAWRTNTLNSPYFCPFLMSSVGQYW